MKYIFGDTCLRSFFNADGLSFSFTVSVMLPFFMCA